ncbi:MAG: flagellar filament capping protein FliD [Lentisphaeria bacterium]|nr:flagellar filament capping protein FliD [Lentisphaeria bacterium]
MAFQLDGLVSGMDTTAVIQSILDAERIPILRKENEIYELEDKMTAWNRLDTKITDLKTHASKLNSYLTWQQKSATIDDEDVVTATADRTAYSNLYSIDVSQLAQAHRIASDEQSSISSDLGLDGDFTVGGETITVSTGDTLTDIRDAINTAASDMDDDEKVVASIIGKTLVIERASTGDTDLTISDGTNTILDSLGVFTGGGIKTELQTSEDLAAQINGVDITSTSNNDVEDAMEGVTLNLKKVGSTTLTIDNDTETIKQLLTDFIESYNDTMSLVKDAGTVVLDEEDEESITGLGLLQDDLLVTRIATRSRGILTGIEFDPAILDQDYNTLQKIGIWTEGQDNALAIVDEDKLDDVLENNFDELEDLIRDLESGVMFKFNDYLDSLISPIDGTIEQRKTNIQSKIDDINEMITDFDRKEESREEQLRQKFTRMEEVLSTINSQGSAVLTYLG